MAGQDPFTSDREGGRFSERESAQTAGEIKDEAAQRGRQQTEGGKQRAANEAERAAAAADRIAGELREDMPKIADYTAEIADSIRDFANQLRHRSIDDLLADTQELARRNPTLFFLGSAAIGVALSRFFKASGEPRHESGRFAEESAGWNAEREHPIVSTPPGSPGTAEGSGLR